MNEIKKAIEMLKSKMDGNTDTSYEWCETVRIAIQALQEKQERDDMRCENCKYSRQSMIGSDLDCEFYIIKGISKRFTTKEKN